MNQRDLPIYSVQGELLHALRSQSRVILSAPTGSGKSTQIPQMILDHGLAGEDQVVVLQPRRLAARLLARRVANERGVSVGSEVGYQVRFENHTSNKTRIVYVTEGILLRRLIDDPQLEGISVVLFDEFHERHLFGDVTLARAMLLQRSSRPDLRLLVMSATLDIHSLASYLEPCEVVTSAGRTFPVVIRYLDKPRHARKQPPWELAANAFEQIVRSGVEGDVLIFMPGRYEIRKTMEEIGRLPASRGFTIFPLHGDLPPADQDAAMTPGSTRKVVISTNIAETSITIEGVRIVIDTGLARMHRFDPYRGINTLRIENISHSAADQRAGRAGRTAPGVCIRLWSEKQHQERALRDTPEILRLDLAEVILSLKAGGIVDLDSFPWIDPPLEHAIERAITLLTDLGGLAPHDGHVTQLGRRLLSFPVHPRYARMLIAAERFECVREAALAAALTQDRSLLIRNPGKGIQERRDELFGVGHRSDLITLIRAFGHANRHSFQVEPCRELGVHAQAAKQVARLFGSLLKIAERQGLPPNELPASEDNLCKCILVGFIDQLAKRIDKGTRRCSVVHGRKGELDKESIVRTSTFLVATEIREIEGSQRDLRVRLSQATAIKEEWLEDLFPQHLHEEDTVDFDASGKRVIAVHHRRFLDLILSSRTTNNPSHELAAALLAKEVVKGNIVLKKWDVHVEQWICRLNGLNQWCPELQLPPISDEDRHTIIQHICHGAFSAKELKDRPVRPTLFGWLSPGQHELVDRYAPERIALPSGRRAKVIYRPDAAPTIAARIQDLYGVQDRISIAMNRVHLIIQVLAPNQRPVQVTDNLSGFWNETYPSVKKELQKKYSKHEWR